MVNPEFFDEPINVICHINSQGHVILQSLSWQGKQHTVITIGRQWDEEDGRHIMAEIADSTRFELQLRRKDLIWYVRKVWRGQMIA